MSGFLSFNLLDILVLLVLVLAAFHGLRRGVLTSVASLVVKVSAVLGAIFFHVQVLDAVDPVWHLREKLSPVLHSLVLNVLSRITTPLPPEGASGATDLLVLQLTTMMTTYTLKVLAFIAVFLGIYFLGTLVVLFVVTPIAKILGPLDRLGGLLFNTLSAFLVLALFCGLFEPFLTAFPGYYEMTSSALCYPALKSGYIAITALIRTLSGSILQNPFEMIPNLDLFSI